MIARLIALNWKAFIRSSSFGTSLIFKLLLFFIALYFIGVFTFLGFTAYNILDKATGNDPLRIINSFFIYYLLMDLVIRYFLQKMPVMNIRPLLYLPIKKRVLVNYAIGQTLISLFNHIHAFLFIPFSLSLLHHGYDSTSVICWHLGIMGMIWSNNFINVLINNKSNIFFSLIGIVAGLGVLQFYNILDFTPFFKPFFDSFYDKHWVALLPWLFFSLLYLSVFVFFKANLTLDAAAGHKNTEAKTQDFRWLNSLGSSSIFLKNDLRLILRNKRSRATILISFIFLFYGLFFFTNSMTNDPLPLSKIFAGIFCTGGFLFSFGQFVPSWDSSYYPLMMSQNILYKDYLTAKWYLIILVTLLSTLFCSFYAYYGWDVLGAIGAGAVYNIGVNAYLVLWGGAYIRTPIDLSSAKGAFGNSQGFNSKTMLLTLPKILLPMLLYALGHYTLGPALGYGLIIMAGILGFALKNIVFRRIERIYKTEKYKTLQAYKEKQA